MSNVEKVFKVRGQRSKGQGHFNHCLRTVLL